MPSNIYKRTRHDLFKLMLYLTTFAYPLFMIVNYVNGAYFLVFLHLAILLINLSFLFKFEQLINFPNLQSVTVVYAYFTLVPLMVVLYCDQLVELSFLWVLSIPLITYSLTGKHYGLLLTAKFTAISMVIFLFKVRFGWESINYSQVLNVTLGTVLIWIMTHGYESSNLKTKTELLEMTTIDPLTKLKDRMTLYDVYSKYSDKVMSLVLIDIDDLRNINDTYGNLAGDVVLMSLAKIITETMPDLSYAFRIGGDDFAILIPNADSKTSLIVAKNIFAKIKEYQIVFKKDVITLDVSIGLASLTSDGNNLDKLINKVDSLLMRAKLSKTDKVISC